ncbi:helix-turn-helix domain-containing protein [Staphylococcus pseudoxylosus]|uniref:helix-turn-helix domain-containing protein n=1 Tax=Staphylococcus pseudoxylosus TaxID=2282419 RepID=UPI003AFB6770
MRYDKLKELMKEHGVTSTRLAVLLNMDRSTLYRKLNMKDDIDFTCTEMRNICLYFNISSDEFFCDL